MEIDYFVSVPSDAKSIISENPVGAVIPEFKFDISDPAGSIKEMEFSQYPSPLR